MSVEQRAAALKAQFIAERGYWNALWGDVLKDDPDYFEAYLNFSAEPWRHGSLAPKVKEFMYIAIDASATHMFKPGLRIHVQNALRHGATRGEIMDVLEMTSEIGIHSCTAGMPILLDEMRAAGIADTRLSAPASAAQQEMKKQFIARIGYWNESWDGLMRMAPEFFASYLELASVPRRSSRLDAKTKELVYIALSAATTNLYETGVRVHIRNALKLGVTADEIAEVLQLISVLGIHACMLGVPVMIEECDKQQATEP